jgi:hypothetical protein
MDSDPRVPGGRTVLAHAMVGFSLFSITLGPGETEANRAPFILLALLVASLVALAGVTQIAPGRSRTVPV